MDNFAFNPVQGFKDTAAYPNPNSEAETREQLFSLHEQTRDFINANLVDAVTSDTVVKIKANTAGFSYSTDGINYTAITGSGQGEADMSTSTYDTNASGVVDNAERVNGHTVEADVPANAVFTDTVYDDTEIQDELSEMSLHFGAYELLVNNVSANSDNEVQINIEGKDELVFHYKGLYTTIKFQYLYTLKTAMIRYIANEDGHLYIGTIRGASDGSKYVRYYITIQQVSANIIKVTFGASSGTYNAGTVSVYGR